MGFEGYFITIGVAVAGFIRGTDGAESVLQFVDMWRDVALYSAKKPVSSSS